MPIAKLDAMKEKTVVPPIYKLQKIHKPDSGPVEYTMQVCFGSNF